MKREEFDPKPAFQAQTSTKTPRKYQVILLNDDYTPMDFVVEILMNFFNMSGESSTQVMWQIHTKGRGKCGTYSKDVAETKVHLVNDYARNHEHPLMCIMEPYQNDS